MSAPKYWLRIRNKIKDTTFCVYALQCSEPGVDPVVCKFNSVDFFDKKDTKPEDYEILEKKLVGVWPPPEIN